MASGVEIGVGFISIVPSMSGFSGALSKGFGNAGKAAESAGKSSGGFFSRAMSTAVGVGMAKVGASAVGALTKPISAGFKGAWKRLTSIEEAQATLSTIYKGNEAMVKSAMDAVDTAVTGTRFAISDAADMAAQLGASGVEGEKMQRWLTLTADAAQVTNKEFSDMQPVLQKVAATGRVTNETFDSFPLAASALSEELGISQEEVRKLAAEGKITSDQLMDALENKIGGAAQNAGGTLSSMIANIKTNWSALFADMLGPLMGALKPVAGIVLGTIQGLRDGITKPFGELLQNMLGPWSENLGKMFDPKSVRESVGNWSKGVTERVGNTVGDIRAGLTLPPDALNLARAMGDVSPLVEFGARIRGVFDSIKEALGGFVEGFGGMDAIVASFSALLPVLMGPLGILKAALSDVFGGGQIDVRSFGETIGSFIGPVVATLATLAEVIVGALGAALASVLPVLISSFQQLLPVIGQVLSALAPLVAELITQLAPILGQLVATLLPVIADLFVQWIPVVMQLVSAIAPLVATLLTQLVPVLFQIISALLPPLMSLFSALVPVIMAVVNALLPIITTLVNLLAPILITLVQALLPPLAQVLAMIANVITTVVLPILTVIINVLGVVFTGVIQALVPIIGTVFTFIANSISNAMNIISGVINIVLGIISGDWSRVWEGIKMVFGAIWDQIKNIVTFAITLVWNIITGVLGLISTVWSTVWELIKAVGLAVWNWIVNTATSIFNGFKDGITFVFTTVRDFFVNIWNDIRDWVLEKITALVDRGREAFDNFKTKVEETFTRLRDKIGEIWEGIQDKVKAPIRFVVNTVINDGLIDNINKLLSKFGVPEIPRIELPQGFEKGGATPKVGDRRVAGVVHGDEHVWTAREVRALPGGHATMYRMRELALARKLEANLPGFFMGGRIPTPGPVRPHRMPYYNARYAADMGYGTGSPIYAWNDGQVAQVMYANSSYGNRVRINHEPNFGQTLYAHMSRIGVVVGQIVKAGQKIGEIGYSGNVRPPGPAGAHLHFEILGGNAPLSGDSGGGSGFMGFIVEQIADTLTAPVRKLIDAIPGDGFVPELVKAMGKDVLDKAVSWVISKAPGGSDDGAGFTPGRTGSVPGLSGVTANTYAKAANILNAAQQAGHRVNNVGGYRGDGEHVTRRALDFMVNNKAAGDFISNYVWSNRGRFGLQHIIWWQRIMSVARASEGWRPMANRGSWTQNHMDHPHVLFNAQDLPGLWRGTASASPGWHWVGERGPELINLRGGEQILPSGKSKELASREGMNITYSPILPNNVDPERQREDFAWWLTMEAGI